MNQNALETDKYHVKFYYGDLTNLVNDVQRPNYKSIWRVGGAMHAQEFMPLQLADDLIIAIMPVILGDGKQFFEAIAQVRTLHLKEVTANKDNMVELWYEIIKE